MQTYTVVLPVLLGYIVWLLKNQKRDRDANSKGTMLLLRVQLIEYHSKYTQLGDIPSYAYQNFCEMYEAYHALGGNGMVTKMKQEIDELHIKRKVINMEQIMNYVKPELIVVAVALYFFGMALKQAQAVKDKYIPLILGGVSIVLCAIWVLATSEVCTGQQAAMAVFTAVTQGILVAGLSNYVNQIIKQGQKSE